MELVEQTKCGERNLPVLPSLPGLPHRKIVRERYKSYPRRRNTAPLHRERHRRDTLFLDSLAYQPHGLVAQRSRRRKQHGVHPILRELPRGLGGCPLDERGGVVYGPHKGEVPVVEPPQYPFDRKLYQGPQGENGV